VVGRSAGRSDGHSYMALRIFMLACGMVTFIGITIIRSFSPPVRGEYDVHWPDPLLVCGHGITPYFFAGVDIASQQQMVKKTFAIDHRNYPGYESSTFRSAFWLLINVMFGVLWYAFRYRSEGTNNPDWTTSSDDEVRECKYNLHHSKAKQIAQAQGYSTPTPKYDLRPNPLASHLQKPTLLH
jgi:hypothetical protein